MIKGCIFDADGTLFDTLYDLGNSMNIVLEEYHYPTHIMSKYKVFVGNGIYKLVERALPVDSHDVDACYKRFNEVYKEHYLDHSELYNGIEDLLQELNRRNIQVSVVTNKPHYFASRLVEKRIKTPVTSIYGEQVSQYPKKPDPTSTMLALKDMHLERNEVLFIGDSNVDIQTANNAGLLSVGVLWGFRGKEELEKEGAYATITNPNELIKVVDDLNNGGIK